MFRNKRYRSCIDYRFSNTLEIVGSIEIGRKLDTLDLLLPL